MTDNFDVAKILSEHGITAVVTVAFHGEGDLAIHASGIDALRTARSWLRQNGYIDGGTFQEVSVGAFKVHFIHPKRPDLELVYLTSETDHFLKKGSRSTFPVINWPSGA